MQQAKLILEDDSFFEGYSFGYPGSVSGEVVFNTGMMGYPESLTDPSYKGQILTFTYPLIGNYGVPNNEKENGMLKNFESNKVQISALIVSDYSNNYHHWNAVKSLGNWLKEYKVPGIFGIDTRELTQKLREKGTMLGKVVVDSMPKLYNPNLENLVSKVSVRKPVVYGSGKKRIVVVDCGCKNNIIRCLIDRNVSVIKVPWNYDFTKRKYDAVVVSNGPGDPKMCTSMIEHLRSAMDSEKPVFGICLGNQIIALAAGADTYKLKYGHRSQNQPCLMVGTKKCYITSQNHGFAVNTKTLPRGWKEWFVNVNDNTNEGIRHNSKPFMSVQFHPEHTCGPSDTEFLFDDFLDLIE